MNIFEKLRLLAEWSPLLTYMQTLAAEDDIHAKAVIVAEALEWVATRTEIEWGRRACQPRQRHSRERRGRSVCPLDS
jgi:hypothetical protein